MRSRRYKYALFSLYDNTDEATLYRRYTNKKEALQDAKHSFKANYKFLKKGEGYAVLPITYDENWECYNEDWSSPLYYEYKK